MDDEFSLLQDNATEVGLPWHGPPAVRRVSHELADGRTLSEIVWGSGGELVLLHGGAQNSHTWDTVMLALDVPGRAIDLPGHGHSSWRDDGLYRPVSMADDVAAIVSTPATVVGMSMGGLTSIALTAHHPSVVKRLILVDVTPGVNSEKASAVVAFISGPPTFDSFDALLQRTIEHNPTRSESSLRRGILHNAVELEDGTWAWRHHFGRAGADRPLSRPDASDFASLWDDVSGIEVPIMLVRGGVSPVVDDDDVAELRRRQPNVRVEVVEGAGHSVQGDKPLELAALIRDFIGTSG